MPEKNRLNIKVLISTSINKPNQTNRNKMYESTSFMLSVLYRSPISSSVEFVWIVIKLVYFSSPLLLRRHGGNNNNIIIIIKFYNYNQIIIIYIDMYQYFDK